MTNKQGGIYIAVVGTILVGAIAKLFIVGGGLIGVEGICIALMSAGISFAVTRLLDGKEDE